MNVGIIGGDKREEYLIEILAEQRDYMVTVLSDKRFYNHKNIEYYQEIKPVVSDSDVIIAPMTGTDQKGYLKATFIEDNVRIDDNFVKLLKRNAILFIGSVNELVRNLLNKRGLKYIELTKRDDLAILNAIPTAEGAIKIAIEKTPFTIYDSKIIIFGLGKVGLTLAWRLKVLGAEVFSVTRSNSAIARGRDLGIKMINYGNLEKYLNKMNIIFNTVPKKIITENYINCIDKEAVIIDLASAPGGTDFEYAEKNGIEAYLCPGIPGKIAPKTSARILGDIIPGIIKKGV